MKKFIMMSVFALGTITASAGNGEKEIEKDVFKVEKAQNSFSTDSERLLSTTSVYSISARVFVCGSEHSTDFIEYIQDSQCITLDQLESIKTMYHTLYSTIYYPTSCNIIIMATHKFDCD